MVGNNIAIRRDNKPRSQRLGGLGCLGIRPSSSKNFLKNSPNGPSNCSNPMGILFPAPIIRLNVFNLFVVLIFTTALLLSLASSVKSGRLLANDEVARKINAIIKKRVSFLICSWILELFCSYGFLLNLFRRIYVITSYHLMNLGLNFVNDSNDSLYYSIINT